MRMRYPMRDGKEYVTLRWIFPSGGAFLLTHDRKRVLHIYQLFSKANSEQAAHTGNLHCHCRSSLAVCSREGRVVLLLNRAALASVVPTRVVVENAFHVRSLRLRFSLPRQRYRY